MPHAAHGIRMRNQLRALLDQTATVYTRTAGAGYTTVVKTGLACVLQPVNSQPAATGGDRAVLNDMRTLYFDAAYTVMPEDGQIEVNAEPGIRWNVVKGTVKPNVGPGLVTIMYQCDVRRQRT